MSFSANVLANIKTINESEDEATGVELLEVLKEFPDSTEMAEVVEEVPNELNSVKVEHCEDPLLGNVETFLRTGFAAEYQEQDFINECSDDDMTVAALRAKRERVNTEFKGRNGHLWSTSKPADEPDDMIIQQLQPKGKGPAQNVGNPLEAWYLLIDERILTQIVSHTNDAIRQRRGKAPHERTTDTIELRAWLGLNYLCGVFRNATQNGPLDELWSLELGNAIFRATMTLKRFEFLANYIHFAEIHGKKASSMDYAQVQDVWEKFLINCRSYYAPSGNCTIDAYNMQGTNTKAGPKLLTICDAKTLYMCNAIMATDGAQDVLRIISDIKGTRRNIVLAEQYTSIDLATKLLQSQLTLVGTLSSSAKEIPPELISGYTNQKLYSGATSLTAVDNGTSFLLTSGLPGKINAEKLHHLSCDACQHFQESANAYSTIHATPSKNDRWSLHFFHQMLDYAAINAWILLRLSINGEGTITQRDFQRLLGLYLTQQQLKRQLQNNNKLTLPQKLQIAEVLGEPTDKVLETATMNVKTKVVATVLQPDKAKVPEGITLMPKVMEKRARCRKCKGRNSRKTKSRCQECLRPLCHRHFIVRCKDCMGIDETEPQGAEEPETDENSQ